jgi:hypothetical protein
MTAVREFIETLACGGKNYQHRMAAPAYVDWPGDPCARHRAP